MSSSSSSSSVAVGIDLGTTYSCVACYRNQRVEVITNEQGKRTMPSYVAYAADGELLVGDAAKEKASSNPKNTIYDVKRLIGRNFSDKSVQEDLKHFSFDVTAGEQDRILITVPNYPGEQKLLSPEQVSAEVLRKLKTCAEQYLRQPVKDVVITVPAYFNADQREATKNAAAVAGLNVLRMINEPTAAALAYNLVDANASEANKFDEQQQQQQTSSPRSSTPPSSSRQDSKKIIVYDFGGGTLDVTLFQASKSVIEVLATSGDTHLGGEDFDQKLIDFFASEFERVHRKQGVRANLRSMRRLKNAAEQAKQMLSFGSSTEVFIDSFFDGIDLQSKISRAKFEELSSDLFKQCMKPVESVLQDAKLLPTDVNELVLVGGSSRIPKVQNLLKTYFTLSSRELLNQSVNADEAIACGAAIQCALLLRARRSAATSANSSSNNNKDKTETSIDNTLNDTLLLDVTPLSIGIESEGGLMHVVVPRNTRVPCQVKREFTTVCDEQDTALISIYEGERALVKDCRPLGKFELQNLTLGGSGEIQIDITIAIDADGIITVEARDVAARRGKRVHIRRGNKHLSPAEIDRMVKDSERFANADQQSRMVAERLAEFQEAVQVAEHLKSDPIFADALSVEEQQHFDEILSDHYSWIGAQQVATTSQDELMSRFHRLSDQLAPFIAKIDQVSALTREMTGKLSFVSSKAE